MKNKLYWITGIYLLLLSLLTLLTFVIMRISPITPESLRKPIMSILIFMFSFILPGIVSFLPVLISGIGYVIIAYKGKPINKWTNTAKIIHLISLISFILAILLGAIPCVKGPPDGFCMIAGAPFMFLDYPLWITGFVVLIIGYFNDKKADNKVITKKKNG